MRTKLSVLFLAVFGFNMAASAHSLDVRAEATRDNEIQISFSTVERHSSICFMRATDMTLESTRGALQGFGAERVGRIEFNASTDPTAPCLMAFGPHRGSVVFQRGSQLPSLAGGKYELIINGHDYGMLEVQRQKVELVD